MLSILLLYLQEEACPSFISSNTVYGTSEISKLLGMFNKNISVHDSVLFESICKREAGSLTIQVLKTLLFPKCCSMYFCIQVFPSLPRCPIIQIISRSEGFSIKLSTSCCHNLSVVLLTSKLLCSSYKCKGSLWIYISV